MDNILTSLTGGRPVVPSCVDTRQLKYVVEFTSYPCVMLKMGDISNIRKIVAYIHRFEKKVMLHMDSLKGVAKDKEGARYLKQIGVDAVISMRAQNIRMLHDAGLITLLGAFLVDSASVNQTIQNVHTVKPDVLIAMPITVPDVIYQKLKREITVPIMGGGLGVDHRVIDHAIECGVESCAVTDRAILDYYMRL
ncbi:MAG: glycerol-3-phosphate responsive antiterminator [Eubacterium sp.]|nr:glycerol-3-phosphate responsive antiterminator [Eubacterium sp.]